MGVTVSVLHTGSSYPDDLANDGVIYHYPTTSRPPGRGASEIEATKEAARLRLPIFVVTIRFVDLQETPSYARNTATAGH